MGAMEWLLYLVAGLFALAGVVLVALSIVSVPGGWIMLGLALIIELCDGLYLPPERNQTYDWWVLGISAVLLALGELVEFLAGAAGVKHGGGSRRGMVGAILGGIGGAIAFTLFVPIPLIGTLIGAVLGTFAGAVLGEISGDQPKTMRGSMKPAIGATIGRIAGSMSKILLSIIAWAILTVSAFWH